MSVGFLALLLYYRSQGGYKVITLGGDEDESGDTSAEEANDAGEVAAEETPSDEGNAETEEGGEE
jgi:hypothetical protein